MSKGKDQSLALTATCADYSITIHSDKPIYYVWRKDPDAKEWGEPIVKRLIGLEFVDNPVGGMSIVGRAFEYQVSDFEGATGYILAGSKIPLVDNRGKLILIVMSTHAAALEKELLRFEQDLAGDGYEVIRRDIPKSYSSEQVKSLIKSEYDKDQANVKTVILFGSCPVKLSGPENYDGHGNVMVAADGYYADMTGDWSGSPGIFLAHLNLVVGRIDFSNLVCYSNKPNNPRSELDLLRQYLNRNHRFRTGQWVPPSIGAFCDGFPDRDFSRNFHGNASQLVDKIEEIKLNGYFS